MNLVQAVHTTGVNWESVAAVAGTVITGVTVTITVLERRSKAIRSEIRESVDGLREMLSERLETKERVAGLAQRIAVLETERNMRRRW